MSLGLFFSILFGLIELSVEVFRFLLFLLKHEGKSGKIQGIAFGFKITFLSLYFILFSAVFS